MQQRQRNLLPILAIFLITACGGSPNDESHHAPPDTGSVSLALRAEVGGRAFELRDAVFSITGPTDIELLANDALDAPFLEQSLPVGEYSVTLETGWSLYDVGGAEPVATPAELVSANPQSFAIIDGVRTELGFRFELQAGDTEIALGAGTLSVVIEVAHRQSGSVVFSEIMANPAELSDSEGEWLELLNTSDAEVDLMGCSIERDGETAFSITSSLTVAPGGLATLAASAGPGFEPSYSYSGLSLPNSQFFTLGLRCNSELLDAVTVDPSTWPGAPGISASLSASASNAPGNDSETNWCGATTSYSSDLGTPGILNPPCE